MKQISEKRGITLISLIITIIALLILAGVSIAMLTSDNGIITNAQKSKISTTFSTYKEEVELYKNSKIAENTNFLENTLEASKISLSYNTKKEEEKGNIKNIITTINDKDLEKFEIIKGKLLINTKDKNEIKVAQSLGIQVNPYDITEEGELLSSDGNLLLVDENGTLKIPDTVTKIGEGAFAQVAGLKTIIIPGSVKEIGTNAFTNNLTLETVIMEEGVQIIGTTAFSNCQKLKNISMPESLLEIKYGAFYKCLLVEKIKIPSKITRIERDTFGGANSLKEIVLSENTEIILSGAFAFTSFEEIVLPKKIKEIESGVFNGNLKLSNIMVEGENPQYVYETGMLMSKNKENIVFISDKYLKDINIFTIPEGVRKFNISLNNYTNITKIIIPETIEYVSGENLPISINEIELVSTNTKYSVNKNKKILYTKDTKEMVICYSKEENIDLREEEILKIGNFAFKQATNAQYIILPNLLKSIGTQVFNTCKRVEEIKIGANVNYIDPLFKYGNSHGKVTIEKENLKYMVENNVLYSKDKTKLYSVLYLIEGSFYLDEKVEEVDDFAFHNQYEMTDINISKSVKEIKRSFNYCNKLTKINIPNNVKKIDNNAFTQCNNVESINVDNEKNSILGAPWGAMKGMRVVKWLR
ncbi:MAG: leucine-rich repeat protein [Clostridia bacterium]